VSLARAEPSPVVRSQLACTCKRLPGPAALPIVEQLLARSEDLTDLHIPLLLWWAVEDKAVSDRARVLGLVDSAKAWNRPITRAFLVERLARRWLAEAKREGFSACARLLLLAPTPAERDRLIRAMERQMEGLHFEKAPEPLRAVLNPRLKDERPSSALIRLALRLGVESAYAPAAARAADARSPESDRADFIRLLGELKRPGSLAVLLALLGEKEPPAVRTAALLALQGYQTPKVASAVLGHYAKMPAPLKDKARDVLVSRSSWSALTLEAVTKGALPAKDFHLEQVRRILLHKDARLRERVEKLWGQVRPATSRAKQGRITAVAQILAGGAGDVRRGKPLAVRLCLNCHQLFGEGEKIGPDLTAADRKNLDVLLPNVIDPSAVIREGYQQFNVTALDGRILSGLLVEDTPEKVTTLDARGVRTTLRKKDIESMTRSESSLMPEGLLDALSDQEMRDLFAFLRSEPRAKRASSR
jgi:putative heme-binding domain-containing protein